MLIGYISQEWAAWQLHFLSPRKDFGDIHVYEHVTDMGFVGAGIRLAPNMARVLDRLGVWDEIKRDAVEADATSIRRMFPHPVQHSSGKVTL